MPTTPTLPEPGKVFDERAQLFLETDFAEAPEGTSEALTAGEYTIMVSRDPVRPKTHWSVNILCQGQLVAWENPPTDDLTLSVSNACAAIREPTIQNMRHNGEEAGFVNLE